MCVLFISTPSKRTISFLKKYKPKDEYLTFLGQHTPELRTSEEKLSKLVNWMRAPVSSALCFSFDPPDSVSCPSTRICDATKCIVDGCRLYNIPLICCLSTTLKGRPLIYVIRSLVAQLLLHHAAPGEQFPSQDFSDIETRHGSMRSGVRFVRELLALQERVCVVVIDNFHNLYGSQDDLAKDEAWTDIFKALRCHKDCVPEQREPHVKVFIGGSDSKNILENLGFAGEIVRADHSSGDHTSYGELWHEIAQRQYIPGMLF
ncbi:hypothetical protein EAF04_006376 [Stromatinia cepivora]|nr:hypothetical protein EAF04_006376 [Stromatinia cepivora]